MGIQAYRANAAYLTRIKGYRQYRLEAFRAR